jgi:hypothetical protein
MRFRKNDLINELYKGKKFNWKNLLKINALLLPNYKNHFKAKTIYKGNGPKMDFQICEFLPLFCPPCIYPWNINKINTFEKEVTRIGLSRDYPIVNCMFWFRLVKNYIKTKSNFENQNGNQNQTWNGISSSIYV